jgi:hypothetical protein
VIFFTPISLSFSSSWSSESTASTTILVKNFELRWMSLLLMAVAASFMSVSRWLPSAVSTAISMILLTARFDALRRPLMMVWLLTPCSTKSLISFSISPAMTTTDVVPSPTSASCERAMSVRMRAAGCTMSRSCAVLDVAHVLVQQYSYLHDCGAIICDRLLAVHVHHEQVTAVGA